MEEKKPAENREPLDMAALESLDFGPDWESGESASFSRTFEKSVKRERGEKRRDGGKRPQRQQRSDDRGRPASGPRTGGERKGGGGHRAPERAARRVVLPDYPLEISILPNQQHLFSLVRQVHRSRRAYPMIDLAAILVKDVEACRVRFEVRKREADFRLFHCKSSGFVGADEAGVMRHAVSAQLEELFEVVVEEAEPPSGQFPGVSRCTKTGTVIGPPNHHSYGEALEAWHQAHFGDHPIDVCKAWLEMVRDEEVVEEWKASFSKRERYRLKSEPEGELLSRKQAEQQLARESDGLVASVRKAVVPLAMVLGSGDEVLKQMVNRVLVKERRFPINLAHSLRAAFRHMKLHMFKVGKVNYVTSIKPTRLQSTELAADVVQVLEVLKEHPGYSKQQLLEALQPGAVLDSDEGRAALKPLGWLIDRGHIVEYFNGKLSLP